MIPTRNCSAGKCRNCFLVAFLISLLPTVLFLGCSKPKTAVRDFDSGLETASRGNVKKGVTPLADEQVAVIETADYGNIVIESLSQRRAADG